MSRGAATRRHSRRRDLDVRQVRRGSRLNGGTTTWRLPNSPTINMSGNAMTLSAGSIPVERPATKWSSQSSGSRHDLAVLPVRARAGWRPRRPILPRDPGGLTGARWAVPCRGPMEPSGGGLRRVASALLRQRQPRATRPLTANITARGTLLTSAADSRPTQFFKGTLDDVRLYSRALTAGEVPTDMNTPLQRARADPRAPTSPSRRQRTARGERHRQPHRRRRRTTSGCAGVQFYVDGIAGRARGHRRALRGRSGTRARYANGAHTLRRARATRRANHARRRVNVNVANSDYFQNEILATGFDLPTAMEFLPDGRMLVVELRAGSGFSRRRTRRERDAVPADHEHRLAGVQQGIYDFALDPNFAINRYYYVFYTLGTPNATACRASRPTRRLTGTVRGKRVVLYQDPQDANAEHHGGASTSATTASSTSRPGSISTPRCPRTSPTRAARSTGSTPTEPCPPTTRSTTARPELGLDLGATGCATRSAPTTTPRPGGCIVGDVGGNDDSTANEEIDLGARGRQLRLAQLRGHVPAPCTSPIYSYAHNGRDASVTGGFVYHGTSSRPAIRAATSSPTTPRTGSSASRSTPTATSPASTTSSPPTARSTARTATSCIWSKDPTARCTTSTSATRNQRHVRRQQVRRIRYVAGNQPPIALGIGNPHLGPRAADRQLLERRLERSRGRAAHIRVELRRRSHVDRGEPGRTGTRGGQVHRRADGVGRREHTCRRRSRSGSAARRPRRSLLADRRRHSSGPAT